jgi:hypothetical protein
MQKNIVAARFLPSTIRNSVLAPPEFVFGQFAPDQLSELLEHEAAPGQIVRRAESLETWAKYWAQEDRGTSILASRKKAMDDSALRLMETKFLT